MSVNAEGNQERHFMIDDPSEERCLAELKFAMIPPLKQARRSLLREEGNLLFLSRGPGSPKGERRPSQNESGGTSTLTTGNRESRQGLRRALFANAREHHPNKVFGSSFKSCQNRLLIVAAALKGTPGSGSMAVTTMFDPDPRS